MATVPLDTTSDALQAQTEAQRRLGGPERLRTASMMSQSVRDMAISRVHHSNPTLDEAAILEQLIFELYGIRRDT